MSLLTRCPACITLFRVVPDQLRISDGWVKCGQCGEIFDASQHLVEEVCDPATQSEVSQSDLQADSLPVTDVPAPQGVEGAQWINPLETLQRSNVDLDCSAALTPEDYLVPEAQAPVPIEAPGELTGGELQSDVAPDSDQNQLRWDDEPLTSATDVTQSAPVNTPDELPVSFLKGAEERPSVWRKPLVRGVMTMLGMLLALLLAGQWVYLERDRLAAQHPELTPGLHVFCGIANCQIQTLRQIESLSVDSVGFHLLGKDTYRLSFTIKNGSMFPLAVPNVELALTDTGNQPVIRRVLSAQELGAAQTHIAAGGEWLLAVALRVTPTAPEQRVFGYRLLIFYP